MAQWVRTGIVQPASGATGTVDVTGFPSDPVFTLFFTVGRTETTDAAGSASHFRGFGWGVSSSARLAFGSQSTDGGGNAASDRIARDDASVAVMTTAGAADGLVDYEVISGGFRLTTDDAFAGTPPQVVYVAVGGDGITATTAVFQEPSAAGNQDITVTGYEAAADDQIVFFGGNAQGSALPNLAVDSRVTFGWAADDGASGIANAVWGGGSNDAAANMQAMSYCRAGECLACLDSGVTATNRRASVSAWLTNGFRLNWAEVIGDGLTRYGYLAVKGLRGLATSILTQTDTTTDITISSLPAVPMGAIYLSACQAASTADTPQNHDELSVGAATSNGPAERAVGCIDEDGPTNAEIATAIRVSDCYINLSTADAVEGAMGVTTWGSSSITHRMSDADPAQAFVGVLVLLEPPAVSSPPIAAADRVRRATHLRM